MNILKLLAFGPLVLSAPVFAQTAEVQRTASVFSAASIVVTASRFEQELEDAPASMSVVSGEEVRRRPVLDVAEAIENEPGVMINSVGMTRRGISIRGMSDEHVLTLVDGKRINDASANMAHVDFNLGWVPSIAMERVEVVRGPLSALYGSEALAGVINIITRRPEDRLVAEAYAMQGIREGEGGNTTQLSALVGGPINEQLGVVAWGEYRHRDRSQLAEDAGQSELEEREALSGSVIGWFKPAEGHRIELGHMQVDDDRARDTVSRNTYYQYEDHITRARTIATYTGDFDWLDVSLSAYNSILKRVNERDQGQAPTSPTKATDFVVDGSLTVEPFAGNRLTVGAEHRYEKLRDNTINAQGVDSVNHDAIFVQDEWEITPGASLTAGSRFDHHPAHGWEASPRAYLVLEPVEGLILRGGVGQAFKAPSLKQLSPGYETVAAGGRFTILGNPDLKPETNTSYEAGIAYQQDSWKLGVTIYQNDVANLVQSACVESCGIRGAEIRTYLNVDKARIRGVEVGGEVQPVPQITLSASYTYVDARDVTADEELEERPKHSAKVQLAWEPVESTSFQLRGRYIGKQLVYDDEPVWLDPYTLWSVDVSHDLTDNVTLKAGVDNIFKKRLADESTLYSVAEPGRVFFVGLGVSL